MSEVTIEQLNTAVGMQKLSSDNEYIKLQLTHLAGQLQSFATKTELEEVKKDFNATIKRMDEAQVKHNEDDRNSFGRLVEGQQKLFDKQTKMNDKLVFWAGGLAIIAVALPILVPLFFHYVLHIG